MNPDPFEHRLSRQPLNPVPAAWRDEILASTSIPQTPDAIPHSLPWWHEWLWPCPQAWAGLVAVWVLLLALHLANREPASARLAAAPLAPVLPYAWRGQEQLLAELFPPEPIAPPRPRVQPAPVLPTAPRSELRFKRDRSEKIA